MLTAVTEDHEEQDAMCVNIPNVFAQTAMPQKETGEERVTMKITGVLVDMLAHIDPATCGPHVVFEKGQKVLHVQVLRATHGMSEAALMWCKKFRKDLEKRWFKFDPHDPCMANCNCKKKGTQHTIAFHPAFHVDDLKPSHTNPKVNVEVERWLQAKHGEHGKVKERGMTAQM